MLKMAGSDIKCSLWKGALLRKSAIRSRGSIFVDGRREGGGVGCVGVCGGGGREGCVGEKSMTRLQ